MLGEDGRFFFVTCVKVFVGRSVGQLRVGYNVCDVCDCCMIFYCASFFCWGAQKYMFFLTCSLFVSPKNSGIGAFDLAKLGISLGIPQQKSF